MGKELKRIMPTSSEPAFSKYLNQKGCALGLPVSGNFELTARCNFDCKMCYVHLKDDVEKLKARELTKDQWLSLASDARDQGLLFLLLTGGEPFVREDFEEIYRELRTMGMMVSVNTNGSLFNKDIRRLFQLHPPTRINVTLYGGSEEVYHNLCGNASYEKVIKHLRQMKEDRHQVRLNVSLTPDNIKDMEKIDYISREIGLQAKATTYMYPPVRVNGEIGTNAGRFTADEAGKQIARWNRLRDTKEIFLHRAEKIRLCQAAELAESCVDVEQEGVQCRAGRSSFWITWDGRMLPCGTMDIESSYPLEIGFSKSWDEVKKRTAQIRLPKECTVCSLRKNCGVCAANCKAETGFFDKKPEYLCEMTKRHCEDILAMAE